MSMEERNKLHRLCMDRDNDARKKCGNEHLMAYKTVIYDDV